MAAHNDSYPSSLPLRMAGPSALPSLVGLGLGLLGLVVFVLMVMNEDTAPRAWNALHFNWMFWSSVAIGMVIFAVALHLTNARWAWSIKRFPLGGVAFLPVSLILFPIMLFGGRHTYFHHWLPHESDGHVVNPMAGDAILEAKAGWLNFPFLFGRDLVALLVLYGLAILFAYHQLRPDVHGLERAGRRGWPYSWLGRGITGEINVVAADSYRRNQKIGVFTALAFAFLWGLIAIDIGMTTLPHFFSTMFPVAFFISAFHSALAMTIVMVVIHRRSLRLHEWITDRQFHDIGKLLFAFAVFWMYINWSQYVVIWYGLLPHEQEYFIRKFNAPFGPVVIAAVMMIFVVPFFGLLPRAIKKMPEILAGFAVLVLLGHWLERFLLVTPNIFDNLHGLPLGLVEIAIAIGFGGLFVACYTWFLRTFPVLPSPVSLAAVPTGLVNVGARGKIVEA
jgi:hypothetical protein